MKSLDNLDFCKVDSSMEIAKVNRFGTKFFGLEFNHLPTLPVDSVSFALAVLNRE